MKCHKASLPSPTASFSRTTGCELILRLRTNHVFATGQHQKGRSGGPCKPFNWHIRKFTPKCRQAERQGEKWTAGTYPVASSSVIAHSNVIASTRSELQSTVGNGMPFRYVLTPIKPQQRLVCRGGQHEADQNRNGQNRNGQRLRDAPQVQSQHCPVRAGQERRALSRKTGAFKQSKRSNTRF